MEKLVSYFFRKCPKSGRIVGLRKNNLMIMIFFPLAGLAALAWFLVRVIPKPSRMDYPCQKIAAPLAFSFIAFLGSLITGLNSWKKFIKLYQSSHFKRAFLVFSGGMILAGFLYILSVDNTLMSQVIQQQIDQGTDMGSFSPIDPPNTPIGVPQGIYPGRVAWAHDPQAAVWDGESDLYTDACFNSQTRINDMLEGVIIALSQYSTIEGAWDELFRQHNTKKGKGNKGYDEGEKVAIKINLNNNGGTNRADATPQSVNALLMHLVEIVGVPEECITVYDAQRRGISTVYNYNQPLFPKVRYQQWGEFVPGVVKYSSEITDEKAMGLARAAYEADYMINMALLKRHSQPTDKWRDGAGQTGITITGKNHFGSIGSVPPLHLSIRDWSSFRGMGSYNSVVDLMSHERLGGNTLVYIVDALYPSPIHNGKPVRFQRPPFNNGWTSSFFASNDEVALQSVALDFIHSELDLPANADNFLHEAAQIGNPTSGIIYAGKEQISLGVHEHWNNPEEKLYSRNMGKEEGIELYRVPLDSRRAAIEYFYTDKPFTTPGEDFTIYWKTNYATDIYLNGKKVEPSGSLAIKPDKNTNLELSLNHSMEKRVIQRLSVRHIRLIGSYPVTDAEMGGTATINPEGFVNFPGEKGTSSGSLAWQVEVPDEGIYYLIAEYSGSEPVPSYLYINDLKVSENFGYEATTGGKKGYFQYPVSLPMGINKIRLEHIGRRSNNLYQLLVGKEISE